MVIVRVFLSVLVAFVIFVLAAGFVTGNLAANIKIRLGTLKKYVVPSEAAMNERLQESARELKERVDQEYDLVNKDGIRLHGYLIRSADPSDVYVFCSHSYRSRLAGFEFAEVARVWEEMGYNLFLIDHRAHGESGGRFTSYGQYEADDCIEWLNFMRHSFGEDIRIILHGQSMGAATVLMMSGRDDLPGNVRCVISDSAYTDFYDALKRLFPRPVWSRDILMWPMYRFLKTVHHIDMKTDTLTGLKNAKVPILFLQGQQDQYVPLSMNETICDVCGAEKERITFPLATHIKSYFYDPEKYTGAVTGFAQKYI